MPMNKGLKQGVIGGIMASLVVFYFLRPIIDVFLVIIRETARLTSSAYYDRIFVQAAMLEERNYAFYVVMLIVMPISVTLFAVSLRYFLGAFRTSPPSHQLPRIATFVRSHRKPVFTFAVVFALANLVFGAVVMSGNELQLRLMTSFKQHMRILAPYLDESQEELIFSEWSRMQGERDHRQIMVKIASIAETNGVALPGNKIYALDAI